jgi:hypothetical protein
MTRGGRQRWNTYDSLLARTVLEEDTGCMLWTGPRTRTGYAKSSMWNKTINVHRYIGLANLFQDKETDEFQIYDLYNDASLVVMHTCDVRHCVNPQHLHIGSQKENMQDAVEKGRLVVRRGEASNLSSLTEEQVISIREEGASGLYSQSAIARRYGISQQQVSRIVNKQRWSHL